MISNTSSLDDVGSLLVDTLGIEDRANRITSSTALFGSLPELDSLAVVELVTAIEDHFGIVVDDGEFTGDTFETLGSSPASRGCLAAMLRCGPQPASSRSACDRRTSGRGYATWSSPKRDSSPLPSPIWP
jgi:acyl carrier protein